MGIQQRIVKRFFPVIPLLFFLGVAISLSGCRVGSSTPLGRVIEAVEDTLSPLPEEAQNQLKRFTKTYFTMANPVSTDPLDYFNYAFKRVRSKYVHVVEDKKLIDAALRGVTSLESKDRSIAPEDFIQSALYAMVASLDPHSSFMNKLDYKESFARSKGEFGGLGVEITMQDDLIKVVAPIEDTPAFRAGILTGDLITHINGAATKGLRLPEAVRLMRGEPSTEITLTLRRSGRNDFEVNLVRALVQVRAVRWRTFERIGYVRVSRFSERLEGGIKRAFSDIRAKLGREPRGIILDLRNNPGGLLDQSILLSDAFLNHGEIVSLRGRLDNSQRSFFAERGDMARGVPMVVLINGGSASAAEIVASSLQFHARATVLGTRSFGKGSVQTIIPMPQEGAIRLTTALYYGPDGNTIQARGITPDITIFSETNRAEQKRESDLPGSIPADLNKDAQNTNILMDARCPAINVPRYPNGDRILGCAIQFLKAGSKQAFLATHR